MRFSGSIRLRPVRIGFLVAPTDLSTIRRIMRLCSCLWGGRYNPIIPFIEDMQLPRTQRHQQVQGLDIARGYIDFSEPDIVSIEASPGMADRLGWQPDHNYFELPRLISIDEFFELDTRKRVNFAAGHDIFDVIAHLYDQEYKFQRRHKQLFALVESGDDAFFELFGGAYPDDEPLKYISDAYRDVFSPSFFPRRPIPILKFLTDGYAGPLWITKHAIEETNTRHDGPTIFVLDPRNPQDLIDCWNYRLVENDTLPVNLNWLGDHAQFQRERIKEYHRPIPGNPYGTMYHTNVEFARSIDGQTAAQLVSHHFSELPQNSFFLGSYPTMWEVQTVRFIWAGTAE